MGDVMTLANRLKLSACMASLTAGLASAASAADAPPANVTSVQEIVVTAQHKSENIQSVPITINAFSQRDIQKLGIQTSTDIGLVTPNVNIALSQGAGNQPIITIRGIGINDENTNNAGPIAVYVDDVYLSSPAAQTFSTFDLERVEVLKGPQGTLYGRNTSGGAINFVSAKPSDAFSANAHVAYSSFNTWNIEGAVGGQIVPDLDGRIAFLKDNSDGYAYNTLTGRHENGANDYAIRGQLLWKPRDDLKVLFNVNGGQIDTRPAQYGHLGNFIPGTQGFSPSICSVAATMADQCVDLFGYTQPKSRFEGGFNKTANLMVNSINASARVDWSPGYFTLTSITAVEHNDKIEPEETDSAPYRELEINWGVKNNTITQEFRAAHTQAQYNWTAGLYYLHEELNQDRPLDLLLDFDKFFGPGSGDGIANRQTDRSKQITDATAAFGQAEWNATDKLKLIAGGRFTYEHRTFDYNGAIRYQEGGMDHFGSPISLTPPGATIPALNNTNFSFRTGLDYNLTRDVLAYASIASGFKSGDFNGGFLSTDPVQALFQLKPISPETDIAYEIGLKSSWFEHRLIANASLFYTDYSNLQVFSLVQSPNGPLNSLTSAQKAHTAGADLEFVAKPIATLTLTANIGLLDTKIDRFVVPGVGVSSLQGLQLAFSPHVSAFLMADYKVPVGPGSLDMQVNASYKGHQFYDSTNDPFLVQNGYWLENVRIGYELGHWEVAGSIKNLSDLKYNNDAFDSTGPFGFIQPVWGTPRWFGVEVNYRY